ncbi:MAG: M23 family metallopeptidase [Leptospiraceae bacterium]|nr:M23 family metallopeptidase [Leptospiraceae bacterium]
MTGAIEIITNMGLFSRLQDSLDRNVRQPGQERLTIMVIPHGQEKIFSLQLNWLMIAFLSGILMLAVGLSVYGLYLHHSRQREIQRLKDMYGLNYTATLKIQEQTRGLRDLQEQVSTNLERIAVTLGSEPEDMESLVGLSDARSRASGALFREINSRIDMAPGSRYLEPIYGMKTLNTYLEDRSRLLESTAFRIKQGISVYRTIPLGRPGTYNFWDSSRYGMRIDPITRAIMEFHSGFDMSGPHGTPINATADGVVDRVLVYDPGYGNAVIIRHANGFYSMYAHLYRPLVKTGQPIYKGQQIGLMGRTGRVTGTHVHYEVWIGDGKRVDPLPYVCGTDLDSATCQSYLAEN